ncbi:hypothetical protein HXY33_04860 [Candidatus Bathyarchaeota archaeon]|nr:hypothetical protein [Candidatus Bathyarchaeota archaeon]
MEKTKTKHYLVLAGLIMITLISGIGAGFCAYSAWNILIPLRTYFGDNRNYSQFGEITTIEWRIVGVKASDPKFGFAESITVLLLLDKGNSEPNETFWIKCALFKEEADSIVKYAETETRELHGEQSPTPMWYVFNFHEPKPFLVNGTYWIVALSQVSSGFPYMYVGGTRGLLLQNVNQFEIPAVMANPLLYNNSASIYCTYNVSGLFIMPFISLSIIAATTAASVIIDVIKRKRSNTNIKNWKNV